MTEFDEVIGIGPYMRQRGGMPSGLMRTAPWRVPHDIGVAEGFVEWSDEKDYEPRFDEADFFVEFLGLAGPRDDDLDRKLHEYVHRWGPLNLCEDHGLPSPHAFGTRLPDVPGGTAPGVCRVACQNGMNREPATRWRDLADIAIATLYAREKLVSGKVPSADLLRRASGLLPWGFVPAGEAFPTRSPEYQPVSPADLKGEGRIGGVALMASLRPEAVIGTSVRQWLLFGDVRPTFRWLGGTYVFGIEYGGLAGAIAVRLASTLMDTRPLVQCAYCKRWYPQTRRGTYFCRSKACDKLRLVANKRNQRARENRRTREKP